MMVIWPLSSFGKKPFGIAMNIHAEPAKVSSATSSVVRRQCSATSSVRWYAASTAAKARSKLRASGLCSVLCDWSPRRKRAANIGISVSDTSADTSTAMVTTTANSWNSSPITPSM